MTTSDGLRGFWELVETDFPPAGVRKRLAHRMGTVLATQLELNGLLVYVGQSESYPCEHPGGPGCPRRIIRHSDGRIVAVCGNDPPECEDVDLSPKDIEILGVSPERLCEALGTALRFCGKAAEVPGLHHVLLAGTFQPSPGVRHSIYLTARCSAAEYITVLDVLRARHGAEGFGLLLPTDRFIGEETIRTSAACGIVVLPLAGLVEMDASGTLMATADASLLFAGIGRTGPGTMGIAPTVFARAFTRAGWQNLDKATYERLVKSRDQYHIFADEHTKEVHKQVPNGRKTKVERHKKVRVSYFQIIRQAIETNSYFDPVNDPRTVERASAKQTLQNARKVFDIKGAGPDGSESWGLIQTEMVDSHSVYRFRPDPKVEFALIFLPEASNTPRRDP